MSDPVFSKTKQKYYDRHLVDLALVNAAELSQQQALSLLINVCLAHDHDPVISGLANLYVSRSETLVSARATAAESVKLFFDEP